MPTPANVQVLAAHSQGSDGWGVVAELLTPPPSRRALTPEQRRTLLHLLDTFPANAEPVPGRGCAEVMAITNYWLSLRPPSYGYYAYLRLPGMEHIALAGMRAVLATAWGRVRHD